MTLLFDIFNVLKFVYHNYTYFVDTNITQPLLTCFGVTKTNRMFQHNIKILCKTLRNHTPFPQHTPCPRFCGGTTPSLLTGGALKRAGLMRGRLRRCLIDSVGELGGLMFTCFGTERGTANTPGTTLTHLEQH